MRSHPPRSPHLAPSSAPPLLLIALIAALAGCGDDDTASTTLPYQDNETVVISPTAGAVVSETPDGDACVELPSGACIRPQDSCGEDAHADVLLDSEGSVIEIVCYPLEGEAVIIEAEDGSASVPSNGAVILLGDEDLNGDLTIEGNRGVIFGDSPDETVINGDLNLRGNESIVRGVRVKGDVNFDGNQSELIYCVIEGDVRLSGNNNFVTNCTVFGSIIGQGNEDRVVTNHVQGSITFSGQPQACEDNWRFTDDDEDFVLDEAEAEAAEPLSCP